MLQHNHTIIQPGNPDNTVKRASRSGDYIRWRLRVADAYRAAGMVAEATLFEECSDPAKFFMLKPGMEIPGEAINVVACSSDPAHLSKAICPSCQLRTCPDCAHRETARLLARYMPTMQQYFDHPHRPNWRFSKIVFTTAISLFDGDIQEQIKDIYDHIREVLEIALRTHQTGRISFSDTGTLLSHEFGPNGLKLHVHALFYGPYLRRDELIRLWEKRTGYWNVSISGVGNGGRLDDLPDAVAETIKYTAKFWKRTAKGEIVYVNPEVVPVLHKAIAGSRRVRSWGLFYNIQEPDEKAYCPVCEAPLTLMRKSEWDAWSQTGFMPDELRAVLREPLLVNSKDGNKSPPHPPPIRERQGVLL
jgi:hypothetical protein